MKKLKFTKMNGLGNNYIYVNCFEQKVNNPEELSKFVSDVNFGIGSDGLILVGPSDKADAFMDIYNSDGSRAKMCGNGVRCVAKFVYDYGIARKDEVAIDTLSGIKYIKLDIRDGECVGGRVNMGAPILKPADVPVTTDSDKKIFKDEIITVEGVDYHSTCVSMGNPHCVSFIEDAENFELEKIGKIFECLPMFPDRINAEFVQIIDRNNIRMRVYERGSGITFACGTGACASAVASCINGYTDDVVNVKLDGGTLVIEWNGGDVYMTGPAETVCEGVIFVPDYIM